MFSDEKDFRKFLSGLGINSRISDRAAKAFMAGAGIITSDPITVSSAEILALNTVGKVLIPAPGPNKFLVPLDAIFKYNHGSAAYTANGETATLQFVLASSGEDYIAGEGEQLTFDGTYSDILDEAASFQSYIVNQSGFAIDVDRSLILFNSGSGPFLDGNGTLEIQMRYRVAPI